MPKTKGSLHEIASEVDGVIKASEQRLEAINSEVHDGNVKLTNLNNKIKLATDELASVKKKLYDYKIKSQSEISSIQQSIDDSNRELGNVSTELRTANAELEDAKEDGERARTRVSELTERQTDLKADIERLEEKRDKIASELEKDETAAKKSIDKLNRQLKNINDEITAQQTAQSAKINEGRRELAELNDKIASTKESITKLEKKQDELVDNVAGLQDRANQYKAQTEEAMRSIKEREAKVESRERQVKIREQNLATRLRRANS